MTQHKSRKAGIRARMAETGEPYTEAARHVRGDSARPTESWDHARIAVAVLCSDDAGHVLLVRPPYRLGWDLPSRYLRPGESPTEAAVELLPDQLGISPTIGKMLVVDWSIDPDPDDGRPLTIRGKAEFIFDAGLLAAEVVARITPHPPKIAEYAFHDPESTGPQLMLWHEARRIKAALSARTGTAKTYLELGV
jgi:8-oxo-dGTP diphosphatase